jgi:molybdate transport system substrate-binding protein
MAVFFGKTLYSLHAREMLQHLGLWDKVQPKLVFTRDVLQVVSYVKTGNADAGIRSFSCR